MFRKVLISAIIVTAVFAAGSAVYAQSATDVDPVFVLLSDKEESKTFDREYVISGNAKEGTVVTIDLYWFKTGNEKSIIVNKKPSEASESEGNWILQQSENYTVGASGIFAESVALNLGKNRIVLFIKGINGDTDEIALELERCSEKQAREEVSGNSLNKFVENMSNQVNTSE
ncbi:MAG: hypothetical protein VB106_12265 [Clostridiaceae bacterium]|jgi:hypothetical protein|nr:hypothetical protein [Clostridiaceae bacterium]